MVTTRTFSSRLNTSYYYLLFFLAFFVSEAAYSNSNEETSYGDISLYINDTTENEIWVRLNVPKGMQDKEVLIMRCEGAVQYIGTTVCEPEFDYSTGEILNIFSVNTSKAELIDNTVKPNTAYSYHLLEGDQPSSISSMLAATRNNGVEQYDTLVKAVDENAVKFYFEPAAGETIHDVQLLYTIDDKFHQTPILEYLARGDNPTSYDHAQSMVFNAQTQTWEYVLEDVAPQTKIDYEFVYQSDKLTDVQESSPSSFIRDGLSAPPLVRRYVDDEMSNQQIVLRWPNIFGLTSDVRAQKSDKSVSYEVYSRQVSLDPFNPWEGDWIKITEQPLDEPELVHNGTDGAYYDYVIVAKEGEGKFQSLPSAIFRTRTAYINRPAPHEPIIGDPEEDIPGAWYPLDRGDPSKAPILFVQGQGDTAQSWWSDTVSGVNDMTSQAANARYRMAFIQLYDKDPEADNSLENNAALLAETLPEIYEHFGNEKVNIVAHGKGGVDVNYALAKLGAHSYVDKVITLASPHQGSKLYDAGLSWYAQPRQQSEQNGNSPATKSMQTAYMQKVRKELDENPNMEKNDYFTISFDNDTVEVPGEILPPNLKYPVFFTGTAIVAFLLGIFIASPPLVMLATALMVSGFMWSFYELGYFTHSVDEDQMTNTQRHPHVYSGNFTYDNIRVGRQTFSLIDKILSCPAGEDVFNCTGLEKPDEELNAVAQENKLPEQLIRGGVVEMNNKQVESFPVESDNGGIYVNLGLSTDYAQVKLVSPSGHIYTKWSQEVQGPARFLPGLGVTQSYWIEKPEAGQWSIELQTDEQASYDVSVYFAGSDAMDLSLSELEGILHSTEPGRDISIGVNAIRQEPENSDNLDAKAFADETFYNVTFDISGNGKHGYFERSVVKSYDSETYHAIINPESLAAKHSALEISEQALKAMNPVQLNALLHANR